MEFGSDDINNAAMSGNCYGNDITFHAVGEDAAATAISDKIAGSLMLVRQMVLIL